MKEKGNLKTHAGPVGFEFCVKVNFPKGLLPPKQVLAAQLDARKKQVQDILDHAPNTKATVDGNTVALYEKRGRPAGMYGRSDPGVPNEYVGIQEDATPVGVGLGAPGGGNWSRAVLGFSGWTKGAGSIVTESCAVHMSATELLASPHANRTLWMFDQLMDSLKKTESMSAILAYLPEQPSVIFVSAAALESLPATSEDRAVVNVSAQWSWSMVAVAAAAGAASATLVALVMEKKSRSHRERDVYTVLA
jgi:hypothetical protein